MVVISASVGASGADLAILRNENSIRHERRQVVGEVTRLYRGGSESGYIEIPTSQIERFERDTAPAPVLAKSQPPASQTATPQLATALAVKTQAAAISQLNPVSLDKVSRNKMISGAGEKHQLDPDFINSVIRAESGFNNRAVSRKGAQGLMQLMPQTASQLGVKNPFDPNANVEGGTEYLRELLEKYNFDVLKALAASNSGSKRGDQYRGVPPYYETQAYIARIIRDFNRQKLAENPAFGRKTKSASTHSAQTTRTTVRPSAERRAEVTGSLPQSPGPSSH